MQSPSQSKSLSELNTEMLTYMTNAANEEVNVAHSFLPFMSELYQATKIDLEIAKKMAGIVEMENKALDTLDKDSLAYSLFLQAIDKKRKIYQEKYNASKHLTNLQALENSFQTMSQLGKKSRMKQSKHKKSKHKRTWKKE